MERPTLHINERNGRSTHPAKHPRALINHPLAQPPAMPNDETQYDRDRRLHREQWARRVDPIVTCHILVTIIVALVLDGVALFYQTGIDITLWILLLCDIIGTAIIGANLNTRRRGITRPARKQVVGAACAWAHEYPTGPGVWDCVSSPAGCL